MTIGIGRSKLFPLFVGEGDPKFYDPAYKHNKRWAIQGPYQTQLTAPEEHQFRQWLQNHEDIYFNPNAQRTDYDMRGFWQGMVRGQHKKGSEFFYPDHWKTPFDTSFSKDSKYAKDGTPLEWKNTDIGEGDLVNTNTGRVIVDHRHLDDVQIDDARGPQEKTAKMIIPNPHHQALYDAARRRVMKGKKTRFAQPAQPKLPTSSFRKQQSY